MAVIELKDIVKTYQMGDSVVHALDHVTVSLDAGEFTSIVGPSGSGKSTMMNIIGCLDRPTSGSTFLTARKSAATTMTTQQLATRKLALYSRLQPASEAFGASEPWRCLSCMPAFRKKNDSSGRERRLIGGLGDRAGHSRRKCRAPAPAGCDAGLLSIPRHHHGGRTDGQPSTPSQATRSWTFRSLNRDGKPSFMLRMRLIREYAKRTFTCATARYR